MLRSSPFTSAADSRPSRPPCFPSGRLAFQKAVAFLLLVIAFLIGITEPVTAQTNGFPVQATGQWTTVFPDGIEGVDSEPLAFAVHPTTGEVYVSRYSSDAGLLRWTGSTWEPISTSFSGTSDGIFAMAFTPQGDLYVAGRFNSIGGVSANNVALYDGTSFVPLGGGVDGQVASMAYDSASGSLYLGATAGFSGFTQGINTDDTAVPSLNVIEWTGTEWNALGQGLNREGLGVPDVKIDPATGDVLFATAFDPVDASGATIPVQGIARWTEAGWVDGGTSALFRVNALLVDSDGSFYVAHEGLGGSIHQYAPSRSTGDAWRLVAEFSGGIPQALSQRGQTVVVGGGFTSVTDSFGDFHPIRNIAELDRSTGAWRAFGAGVALGSLGDATIETMIVQRDDLWIGGDFFLAGGRASLGAARWQYGSPGFDAVPVQVRLDVRRGERSNLFDAVATDGQALAFVEIANGPNPGRFALLDLDGDSLHTTTLLVPRNQRVGYRYGVDYGVRSSFGVTSDLLGDAGQTLQYEGGGERRRSLVAADARVRPVERLDDAAVVAVPAGADANGRERFFVTNPPATLLVTPLGASTAITVDPELLPRRAVFAGGIYRRGPGGTAPDGIFNLSGNTFWWMDGLPGTEGRVRVTFDYSSVSDIYAPEDLRLLRRASTAEPWSVVESDQDLNGSTLSATLADIRGQWTLGSVSNRNPMEAIPPQAARTPNPADGSFGVPVTPRLEWVPGAFAQEYDIYVWREGSNRPASPAVTTESTSAVIGPPAASELVLGAAYNWQVVARNPNGAAEGPVWRFETDAAANLVISDVSVPQTAVSGQEIEVRWTVTNTGAAPTKSPSWGDAVYLSRDDSVSVEDGLLARPTNPAALEPGASYRQTARVDVPVNLRSDTRQGGQFQDLVEGDFRILVRTDDSGLVNRSREAESDENDNLAVSSPVAFSLPNLPDLRVQSINPPVPYCFDPPNLGISAASAQGTVSNQELLRAVPQAQTSATGGPPRFQNYKPCDEVFPSGLSELYPTRYLFSWEGVNEGTGPADGFTDAIYYHADSTLNTEEALLLSTGQVTDRVLPGETYTAYGEQLAFLGGASVDPEFSVSVVPDSGFFFVVGDPRLIETDKGDLIYRTPDRYVRASLPPSDVVVESVSAPTSPVSGEVIDVTFTLRNLGPSSVVRSVVQHAVYLSRDDTFSPGDDQLLTEFYYENLDPDPLSPDETDDVSVSVRLPDGNPGTYTLFVVADTDERLNEFVNDILYRDNNVGSIALDIALADYADLTPTRVDVPGTAFAGQSVVVNYEVSNAGPGDLSGRTFRTDGLFLSDQTSWNGADEARLLRKFQEEDGLARGAEYARNRTLTLPRDLSPGTYYVHLVVDTDSVRYESDETNNVRASAPVAVTAEPQPDLVASLTGPVPSASVSGAAFALTWRVENQGAAPTRATSWTDAVYLSTDGTVSSDDVVLARVVQSRPLAVAEGYDATANITLPADLTGTYSILLAADETRAVQDGNRSNNAAVSSPVEVRLPPAADLRVSSFTLDGTPRAGQPLRAVVEVTNDGADVPAETAWSDVWTLSPGTESTSETVTLLSEPLQGPLASGATYTQTVDLFLPEYASGSYQVAVITDRNGQVTEGGRTGNNVSVQTVDVTLPPLVDLVVTNVEVPADAEPGQETTITYDVVNQGENAFSGVFYDALHLSLDAAFDASDPRLAFIRRSLTLEPQARQTLTMRVRLPRAGSPIVPQNAGPIPAEGEAPALGASPNVFRDLRYGSEFGGVDSDRTRASKKSVSATDVSTNAQEDATGTVPNLVPGQYRVIAWTDVRRGVRESDDTNNRTASANSIVVGIPTLTLDQPEVTTLQAGRDRYYQLTVPAGRDLQVRLDAPATFRSEEFELYVAYDRVPSPGNFDRAFAAESDVGSPKILVPSTQAGTYYLLVRNRYLSTAQNEQVEITLTAEAFDFGLLTVTPDAGGTQGRTLVTVTGSQLTETTDFYLFSGAGRVDGQLVRLVSSMEAEVRFDLQGVAVGTYDFVAAQGSLTAELRDGFEVQVPSADGMGSSLTSSTAIARNQPFQREVTVTNQSNVDYEIVILTVVFPQNQRFTLSSDRFRSFDALYDLYKDDIGLSSEKDQGFFLDVALSESRVASLGGISMIARDVRVGETLTATLSTLQFEEPAGLAPFGVNAVGLTKEEFLEFAKEGVPLFFDYLVSNESRLGNPSEEELKRISERRDEIARFTNENIERLLNEAGLLGTEQNLGGSASVSYVPPIDNLTQIPSVSLSSLARKTGGQSECEALGTAVGLGIAPAAVMVGGILALTATGTAAFIGVVAAALGAVAFIATIISLTNEGSKDSSDVAFSLGLTSTVSGLVGDIISASAKGFGINLVLGLIPFLGQYGCEAVVESKDPNDIVGPKGVGEAKWVRAESPLDYKIRFENDAEQASAPAQFVRITQTLDDDFDLRTFRVLRFGFSGYVFELPENGRAYYTDRLDLRDSLGLFVDVSTRLDVTSRQIELILEAIDPDTGDRPADPLRGFLPPNVTPPEGDGFFDYRVTPIATAPHESVLDASARIFFDANAPIDTPPIFNTLDASLPETPDADFRAAALDTSGVRISWRAEDIGSGPETVTLYARQPASPDASASDTTFAPVSTGLTGNEFVFEGRPGVTYEIFARARDQAGNFEPEKPRGVPVVFPVASSRQSVLGPGRVEFGSTGVAAVFSDQTSGTGIVRALRFDTPPSGIEGISETTVSLYRVVVASPQSLGVGSASELRFDTDRFPGIGVPGAITVYSRPDIGEGSFVPLPTRFDASSQELVATVNGFSEFVLASDDPGNPLPVEMASLTGVVEDDEVALTWSTASETNNSGFEVQRKLYRRSANAVDLDSTWQRLGFVPGRGTSTKLQEYRYTDADLPFSAGSMTYRLRQVDLDGRETFSDEIRVERSAVTELTLRTTFPNPAREWVTVQFAVPERGSGQQRVTLRLYDLLGRRVREDTYDRARGRVEMQLRLGGLASGTYFLRLSDGHAVRTQRLTVVR